VLDKDERMCPRSRKYQEAKFVIENTLDTARYTGPMMKNFSSVRVDITNNRFNSNWRYLNGGLGVMERISALALEKKKFLINQEEVRQIVCCYIIDPIC